jgi:hypothetical protein
MFLSYLALFLLIIVIIVVVYVFIWIHDIPYMLAKKRNHPNLHAIHIACWLSLFTLHALWPFVFIWAIAQKPRFEVIIVNDEEGGGKRVLAGDDPAALRKAIHELHARLDALEKKKSEGGNKHG